MNLPEGSVIGTIRTTLTSAAPLLANSRGVMELKGTSVEGFILMDRGVQIAAYYWDGAQALSGKPALDHLTADPGSPQELRLRVYTENEFGQALAISQKENLLLQVAPAPSPVPLDERRLEKIQKLPGVLAVAAFSEGFSVYAKGKADFEQIAAVAEDLLRAGKRIADDIRTGGLEQVILETTGGKFIIAPCGDLYLCLLAESEANLGLIRVALRALQSGVN
ncbi:MAG: roadblock/LC7 domain-containing protein [Methanomicrobiales archaeon]|nr:roadblock/LC7 domain-containing protein [Methanomicrobiales archaeon]